MSTFQSRSFKSFNLLPYKDLEGTLRHKQTGSDTIGIFNGCPYVIIGQDVEWVHARNGFTEYLVEDMNYARPSIQFL